MSLSFGSSKSKTNQSSDTNPWDETIPGLTDLIAQISGQSGNTGATSAQSNAFAQLEQNASQGNPYAGQIGNLSADLFNGVNSRSGQIEQSYNDLANRLTSTANGDNLDPSANPYTAQMLQQNANDVQNRINSMFAGAGRDLSGKNQESLARGISEGTVPALFNQYNQNVANQFSAANALNSAGTGAASAEQGLDTNALLGRLQALPAAQASIDANNYGPNTILNLEQQLKGLPLQDIGNLEALLAPLAGLGSQSTGQSKTSGSTVGGSANLGMALGALSDERTKEGPNGGKAPKVGKLNDGTPVHLFKYKGDPTGKMQIGVMAQDIEKKNPGAVTQIGGVKFLDYGKAAKPSIKKGKR